ncbi:MAG: hypothetical protein DU429_08075 [Candidatus Tokpelaia sp.]|nr:MAG: hypothetical protein DU430_08495 [Candidatus Tokpelaia sp.]KAA6205397.1 MAG: hypothetical protein DU429_08075 [Candidatus Tokpelaia sp.]
MPVIAAAFAAALLLCRDRQSEVKQAQKRARADLAPKERSLSLVMRARRLRAFLKLRGRRP